MKWVVGAGDWFDKVDLFGPFDTEEQARKFAEQEIEPEGILWQVSNMFEPEEGWDNPTQ